MNDSRSKLESNPLNFCAGKNSPDFTEIVANPVKVRSEAFGKKHETLGLTTVLRIRLKNFLKNQFEFLVRFVSLQNEQIRWYIF